MSYLNEYKDNCSTLELNIDGNCFIDEDQLFIQKFKPIFSKVYFTRLNINSKIITIQMFIQIIHLLPNLDSLKVFSLPQIQSDRIRFLPSSNNKITKVNFEKMISISQVHFLLSICPCIEYFQMGVPNNMDLSMLTRFLLHISNEYYPHFNSVCLSLSIVNEDMVHQLRRMIQSEKLVSNFNMKCLYNNILFKWNRL
jgi:hypothetical protein